MAIKLVEVQGTAFGLYSVAQMFSTTPFPYFLHSSWHCLTNSAPTFGCDMSFGSVNFFTVTVRNVYGQAPSCEVQLMSFTHPFYDAVFALPPDVQWHVLVSVNCALQIVQVYCNDQPCALINGGWTSSGLLQESSSPQVSLNVGQSGSNYPAVADIWEAATPGFVDLTSEANRRKFINADLSPAFLGVNGALPFGYQPPIFLSAVTSAADLATNYGSGGPFSLSPAISLVYQPPTCPLPVAPPPSGGGGGPPGPGPVGPQPPAGLREATYRLRFLGKSYDPTVTVIKDRPGPLRIVEFEAWIDDGPEGVAGR